METKTGLIYDNRMAEHNCWWDSGHIERPERYLHSLKKIQDYKLEERCRILPSRFATEEELRLVHTEEYINKLKTSQALDNVDDFEKFSSQYDSVYFNPKTYECALLAAGCTLELVSSILNGSVSNGLALVRPPGHHAMVKDACGFCFFNNVAIAAKYALEHHNLKRILIVDWDVHHGQGTQQIFYDDPRVLYFSIHRYESGDFWPNLRESHFDFVGGKSAQGFNINVPLNEAGQGNAEYLAIFNNVLLPIAYEFCPELVLISSGYDAAIGCVEGEMKVTPQAYPHLLNSLSCLANGRVCVLLEGGYCLSSLSEGVALTLRGLLGDPCPTLAPCSSLNDVTVDSILNALSVQRPFWESVRLQNMYDVEFDDNGSSKHLMRLKYTGNPFEGWTVFDTRGYYPIQPVNVKNALEAEIKDIISNTDLSVPDHRTCFLFDQSAPQSECHLANHAEAVKSVTDFYKKLQACGLLSKCVSLQSKNITEEEMSLIKDSNYRNEILPTPDLNCEILEGLKQELQTIKLCQESYISAGGPCEKLLQLINSVALRKCVNGFALVSPPGHFPDTENTSGFSVFSSVAVAAKFLVTQHKMDRVLIIDWNIRQGNSTQNFFYDDNKVLYVSMHYHDGDNFPTSPEAKEKQDGRGVGKGFNVNIPFHHAISDGDYLAAFFNIVLPIAYEFCPQFVLVSLGYDDSASRTRLSPACFSVMTRLLGALSNGKMVVVSEENLSCENAPDTAAHCLSALLGENCVPLRPAKPSEAGIETIQNVTRVHKNHWKCLAFDVEVPDRPKSVELVQRISRDQKEVADQTDISDQTQKVGTKRRQSSDPVAIPKFQDVAEKSSLIDYELEMDSDAVFCVTPLEYCPHLELLQPLPNEGLNVKAPCQACNDLNENWVCLHCYQVYCGRFINQHMLQHGMDMKHYLTLSFSDLSVWCYACEAYIHNNTLAPIKDHAHDKKFNLI